MSDVKVPSFKRASIYPAMQQALCDIVDQCHVVGYSIDCSECIFDGSNLEEFTTWFAKKCANNNKQGERA